jgi:hypothetical protein
LILSILLILSIRPVLSQDQDIDWNRARALHQRAQNGEKLNPEDQAYYAKARAAMAARNRGSGAVPTPKDSTGLIPLSDLGKAEYKGEMGGLYGGGSNDPPAPHLAAARAEAAKIRPLDNEGKPAKDGKVVLLSIGMSNTTQEFSIFKQTADLDPRKSPSLVIVDGAQGGQAAEEWLSPDARPWSVAEDRLRAGGVTNKQVQAVWIKQALIQQGRFGDFPAHARRLEADLVTILQNAKQRFPNLRIAYLSSRIYGGYASTALNPEPYAYEGAFSVRWVIQRQIKSDTQLNFDPAKGAVKSPIVLWGPYLWSDGVKPRKADRLVWAHEDLNPGDGTHPSQSGRRKVAELLLKFFTTDSTTTPWFVRPQSAAR